MATVTLKGNQCSTSGELPAVGSDAPDFTLVAGDLSEKSLADYAGKQVVLNIVPSLDTGTCALSAKTFNGKATEIENTTIINVSKDLPFAQGRFCEAESLEHVNNLSAFRCSEFGSAYGVALADGPLKGLLTRAVVIIGTDGKVKYTELVPEIVDEPNYDAALSAL